MKFAEAKKEALKRIASEKFKAEIQEEDPRMVKFIPTFLEFNKLNFLSTNSQAGHHDKGISVFSGKPYTFSERAYLEGFMLEKDAEDFIKNMGLYTDKCAIFLPHCENIDIPRKLDIPLTITEEEGKVTIHTHMSTAIPTSHFEFMKKLSKLNNSEKVVMIFCWDPVLNRLASGKKGLFTDVIRVLKMN